ncbi:GNAT family N-acetyltransferase [Pedosphaera parvula]|uniref:GNAT family N-acetyltransferase n=1 Tax=Pedosphaera parvula TaxID=1032527 RepID=UPI00135F1296|nr:GNAT family protein [Pedosphaera parvula]
MKTERLTLREIIPEDVPEVFNIFSHPEVMRYYDMEALTEPHQALEVIARFTDRYHKEVGIRWGITLKHSGEVIGTCGLVRKPHNRSAVLGYDLAAEFWGQGIMTEALRPLLTYAFDREVNRIEAMTHTQNTASQKVLTKLGFRTEGILRDYFYFKGEFFDLQCFSLLKKDFEI